ncbi:hypothetical protein HDU98_003169 [Podochytrium sp. JEL0797]|nr:hypothetical protein HDU98_003169 [Podochytrium sp. JEL0797]
MADPSPPLPSLADLGDVLNQVAANQSLLKSQQPDTISADQQITATPIETLQSSLSATQSCINSLQTSVDHSESSIAILQSSVTHNHSQLSLRTLTLQNSTEITDLPSETALQILSWIRPKEVWKLRGLSRAFKAIISSPAFARANLARCVPRPDLSLKESKRPATSDLAYLVAPQTYQEAHIRAQWTHLTKLSWNHGKGNHLSLNIPLPQTILTCKNLVVLTFCRCSLTGCIPSDIGNVLKSLQRLDLSHNNLVGGIPISISRMKQLMWLDLSYNQLSGVLPTELGQVKNLQLLLVSANRFTGPLPPQFGNLAGLNVLDISMTEVSGPIPSEWGNLRTLNYLKLANNPNISGTIPSSFANLSQLQTLSMFGCGLSGFIPPELGRLANLEKLDLRRNSLSGEVPVELADLERLENCFLDGNPGLICLFEFHDQVEFKI